MPTPLSESELTAAIAELPPVSGVLQRILTVLRDPHSDLDDIARLVKAETALAAQVVRLANSVHFGLAQPVASVDEAIQQLGFAEINRLVCALGSKQLFLRPLHHYGVTAEALWQHTLAVAVCAEVLAGYTKADRSVAYLAGILHPVGLIALDRTATARQLAPRADGTPLTDWEHAQFGTDNAGIAARVLRAWKFPDNLLAAVAGRYTPGAAGDQIAAASVLHVASCLAERLGSGLPPEKALFPASADRIAAAGLHWDDYADAEMEATQQLERTRALLNLA